VERPLITAETRTYKHTLDPVLKTAEEVVIQGTGHEYFAAQGITEGVG